MNRSSLAARRDSGVAQTARAFPAPRLGGVREAHLLPRVSPQKKTLDRSPRRSAPPLLPDQDDRAAQSIAPAECWERRAAEADREASIRRRARATSQSPKQS